MGNGEPGAGRHITPAPLSDKLCGLGTVKFTRAKPGVFGDSVAAMLAGQVMAGGETFWIVTVKLQSAVLLAASVARQLTVVEPSANVEPLAGVQTTVTPGQLSVGMAE